MAQVLGQRAEIGVGFMGGTAGVALFLHHYGRLTGDVRASRAATAALAECIDAIGRQTLGCSLSGGWCGVLWVLAHLERMGFGDYEGLDLSLTDAALLEYLRRDPIVSFDLISGLCGIGVYALERNDPSAREELVAAVVALLQKRARRDASGVCWVTMPEMLPVESRAQSPRGHLDFGLAHGTPGVIAWLSAVVKSGRASESILFDLREAVRWLRGFAETADDPHASVYPTVARWDMEVTRRSRVAWCYGDLSVGAALLAASEALADRALRDHVGTLVAAAARRDEDTAGVVDASFCHGASGVAYLLRRLAPSLQDREIADSAAMRWLRWIVQFGERNAWTCMYSTREGFVPRLGLLEGASGVGLTILEELTASTGDWDRAFLCHFTGV